MASSSRDCNDAAIRPDGGHQRSKSSVLKSFMHRRNQSDGSNLPSGLSIPTNSPYLQQQQSPLTSPSAMEFSKQPRQPEALGELQQNQQEGRSPRKARDERHRREKEGDSNDDRRGRSPTKSAFRSLSRMASRDPSRHAKSRDPSPEKPKKNKSSTNIAGLLSRPKSSKSLNKQAQEEEARAAKDKENRTPPASSSNADLGGPPPPIFAQFSSQDLGQHLGGKASFDMGSSANGESQPGGRAAGKERPRSFQSQVLSKQGSHSSSADYSSAKKHVGVSHTASETSSSERVTSKSQRPKIFTAFSAMGNTSDKAIGDRNAETVIDPKDINALLEAMLDRRNIPENQRFKMRNLNDTIKMEFIRQDWAETAARNNGASGNNSVSSGGGGVGVGGGDGSAIGNGTDSEESHPKRTRGRSFTLGKSKKDPKSPTKKSKGEGTLGRHFRTKSSDSIASERPSSSGSGAASGGAGSVGGGILSKIKLGQGPGDFVAYLRKVQKPELVEVGKLHKLRLLLRNETVSWTEDFIQQGGMKEIVGLLNRILEVEWREEHEDALLHEDLLCLKALCTTALALQYLDTIQSDLFPKLVHMLFDPEKKGPSDYTTRNIVTSVLFTYIESASAQERVIRSKAVLSYLRNPKPKDDHVPFVLEMHKERPYTVWNKEVVSVTKEVFWIFLHTLNVVALPSEMATRAGTLDPAAAKPATAPPAGEADRPYAYMHRHFPRPRPPVPAAPYVGGVEWDATNYLASHLDLVNAALACTPTADQRNALREEMRISGWERCMGGTMRLCKEKFYGCVHEGLRTWVAAAAEDGWPTVRDVRYGPPPEDRARSRSPRKAAGNDNNNNNNKDVEGKAAPGVNGAGNAQKQGPTSLLLDPAPRIEMPKLDFGLPSPGVGAGAGAGDRSPALGGNQGEKDYWLS